MANQDPDDAFACQECRALEHLYRYWFRNVEIDLRLQAAIVGSPEYASLPQTLSPQQVQFLHDAIAALRAYMLRDRALAYVTPIGQPEPNVFVEEELDLLRDRVYADMQAEVATGDPAEVKEEQTKAIARIRFRMEDLDELRASVAMFGLRAIQCDQELPLPPLTEEEDDGPFECKDYQAVDVHIHRYLEPSGMSDAGWCVEGEDPVTTKEEDERLPNHDGDGNWYGTGQRAGRNPSFDLAFLHPMYREEPVWSEFVADAESTQKRETYFSASNAWSIQKIEELREATIRAYYNQPDPVQDLDDDIDDVAAREVQMLRKREALRSRKSKIGFHDEWAPMYHGLLREALDPSTRTYQQKEAAAARHFTALKQRELEEGEGPANTLFVWRLVVVHLRMLRRIGSSHDQLPAVQITKGFDMASLVQNVAHILKYRRCIKLAKSIYKTAGTGSLHDQYRAKLLNMEHAHAHQDESPTELGIARRIIRQAHVANYHAYLYETYKDQSTHVLKRDIDTGKDLAYDPEEHLTNPPMAPIMCSAPPRMGKSALSILVASFAVKLGGRVLVGVAPNSKIPKEALEAKVDAMHWRPKQNLTPGSIQVYSEDESSHLLLTNRTLHELASSANSWVLHIRDEAQSVIKQADRIKALMDDTLPLFYNLNMCVSATLLPVCISKGLTGSIQSVKTLMDVHVTNDPCNPRIDERTTRSAWEKFVVKQPWSFPVGPDFLVPSRSYFPTDYPEDMSKRMDAWYKAYYAAQGFEARETNYYGTWFHVEEFRNGDKYLSSKELVLIDDSLERNRRRLLKFLLRLRKDDDADKQSDSEEEYAAGSSIRRDTPQGVSTVKNKRKGANDNAEGSRYDLSEAYAEALRVFNMENRWYFNEALQGWQPDGPLRVVNAPIASLSRDAVWLLEQASNWMEESPRRSEPTNATLYPTLISAPVNKMIGKNGRIEWAVLLCKIAWLRMHKDYVRGRIRRDTPPDILAAHYGLTVLLYTTYTDNDKYAHIVASPGDIRIDPDSSRLVAITFDPRLPENRFRNHKFTLMKSDGTTPALPTGTLMPNALVPTIDAQTYANYQAELKVNDALSASDFLQGKGLGTTQAEEPVPINKKLYRFDMTRCYRRGDGVAQEKKRPYNLAPVVADEPQYAQDPESDIDMTSTADEGGADGGGDEGVFESDLFDDMSEGDASPSGASPLEGVAQRAYAFGQPFSDTSSDLGDDAPVVVDAEDDWEDAWQYLETEPPETRGDDDILYGQDDDKLTADCDPDGSDPFGTDPLPITDMNGIALRLCVTGFKNAQDAIEASYKNCNIVKVAALGYQMFEAGLTLQTTFKTTDANGEEEQHLFVPKYMNFAISLGAEKDGEKLGPDLSHMYQLIGRGFVDMKERRLPSDWKLNLLSREGMRNFCKLYGNAELLFSQIGNESIEGRKLTLGTTLDLMTSRGNYDYDQVLNKWVMRLDPRYTVPTLNDLLLIDTSHKRPFRNTRYCFGGRPGSWPGPARWSELTPNDLSDEATGNAPPALLRVPPPRWWWQTDEEWEQEAQDRRNLNSEVEAARHGGAEVVQRFHAGEPSPAPGDNVLDQNLELYRYERVLTKGIHVGRDRKPVDDVSTDDDDSGDDAPCPAPRATSRRAAALPASSSEDEEGYDTDTDRAKPWWEI